MGVAVKKIIIFMFIFPTHIFALNVEQTYNDGMSAYKSKNYTVSYELLSSVYLTKLSNATLNFALGMSAYETGHYEIALASFERVEMLDPTNIRNKLEKARAFFMLKMYEDAELAFKEVLNNPMLPKNVRLNVEFYLSKVTKVQQKSFTYATVNLDWIYDSNVNYGSFYDTYMIDTVSYATTDKVSDRALQTSLDLINIYDIGDTNGYALKNRVVVSLKDYSKENDYDIQYLAYIPSILHKDRKYTIEMLVGIDTMTLAQALYLKTVYFMPKVEYAHNNNLRSIIYTKYQRKFFQQSTQTDLNADHYEFSYGLQSILSPRSYVQANIVALKEKKHKGDRTDVDYKEYEFNAVYTNQFSSKYTTQFYGEVKQKKYNDLTTLLNSTRADIAYSVSAKLSAKIMQSLSCNIKALYNRSDSNQNVYSYQKYTISAGIVKTF